MIIKAKQENGNHRGAIAPLPRPAPLVTLRLIMCYIPFRNIKAFNFYKLYFKVKQALDKWTHHHIDNDIIKHLYFCQKPKCHSNLFYLLFIYLFNHSCMFKMYQTKVQYLVKIIQLSSQT